MGVTVRTNSSGVFARANPIEALQAAMLAMPQFQPETEHLFHGGLYCRTVARPKGCLIVGKRHRKPHLYIVLKGEVALVNEAGEVAQRYPAGSVIACHPGTKRAVLALEDSVCMTVHATKAKTVEGAESILVEPEPDSPFLTGNTLPQKALA